MSDGDLGPGGRLGTNYLFSERTTLYLNYALENERTDNGLRGGRRGNLISGMKRRLSDSSSMFVEERYQETDRMSGLTHATGMTLAPNERWNFGANTDIGTLTDELTGAKIDREAGGIRMGYGFQAVQLSSAVEYRLDKTEQPDAATSERTTWLFRNSFKFQLNPDWRVVGKYNHAKSESSLGQFYDGGYTEAVLGYGYRPVAHDRLNALAKYTYFYNVPTTEQVTPTNSMAQFVQKSHVAALDLTYDLTDRVVDRRQVRLSPRPVEPRPRAAAVLRQPRAAVHPAHGPEVRRLGRAAGRAHARHDGPERAAQRRARRGVSLLRQALQGRRRLQLHRLLGRPDGPELPAARACSST